MNLMDTMELQARINELSELKIKNGEYIASPLGPNGTGLGVYLVKGNWKKHETFERSARNLSRIYKHLISPQEVLNHTLGVVIDLSEKKCEVHFVNDEWDNNENRILEITIDEDYTTLEINDLVNSMKNSPTAQEYVNGLYEKGVTDIVISTTNRQSAFTYFLYNVEPKSLYARIYRENVFDDNYLNEIHFIRNLDGAIYREFDEKIELEKDGKSHVFNLKKFEVDISTTSYYSELSDGTKVRIIRPHGYTLEQIKQEKNVEDTFSIGSVNPDGYGIFFHVTEKEKDDSQLSQV